MSLIARLAQRLTIDLTRNPAPSELAPTPKRAPDWKHARIYAATHAKLRAEVDGEGA